MTSTRSSGNTIYKPPLINIKSNIITIGVKSNGQIAVGMILFTLLYKGSIISAINFGLKFIHIKGNHDKITSNITIYEIISIKTIIAIKKVIFIFLYC